LASHPRFSFSLFGGADDPVGSGDEGIALIDREVKNDNESLDH